MKFSIGIICSNDHLIERCIESIPKDIPIIVILNYPDQFVEKAVAGNKQISVYRCDERNLGKLRQLAADKCKTPAICYIDSDCIVPSNLKKELEKYLKKYEAVNIPIDFDYVDRGTKITSNCRKYTTPDELLFMPFAFRLSLQDKIGTLFNDKLAWGEDSDQRWRLKKYNIKYGISKARVKHKPLTIQEDSRSAVRLGRGTYLQEEVLGVKKRSFLHDINVFHEVGSAIKCSRLSKSTLAGLYHFFIWRPAYKYGYWKVRWTNDNQSKN